MTVTSTVAPTAPAPTRRERMLSPVLTLGGLGLATWALHLRDPHQHGSWGLCPSSMLGISCPGCGGLRAVNDLTHLDLAAAASSNLLFVASVPLVLVALVVWVRDRWLGVDRSLFGLVPVRAWQLAGLVAVVFTVARNLPFGSYLAP